MESRILVIGDIHIKTSNIPDIDFLLQRIKDEISNHNPDFVVLLGDILDTFERLNTFELNKAYEVIDEIRKLKKVYVIIGNHDMVNCAQFLTENHWANALKLWNNVIIVDKVLNDNKFIFVPYVPNGRFEEAMECSDIDYTDENILCIFAHQEFYGCKMGSIISETGDVWDMDYPLVISGHIHLNQRPQKNIYYVGSSTQVSYGETQENLIVLVSFKDKKYDLKEIKIGNKKKKILYTTIDDIGNINEDCDDKTKISVSGNYEEFKTFKKSKEYKKLVNKGVNIIFKQTRKEKKLKNEEIQEKIDKGSTNFEEILYELIDNVDNPYMRETYELVINNKHLDKDVLIL